MAQRLARECKKKEFHIFLYRKETQKPNKNPSCRKLFKMKIEKHGYNIQAVYKEMNNNIQIKKSNKNSACIILNTAFVN